MSFLSKILHEMFSNKPDDDNRLIESRKKVPSPLVPPPLRSKKSQTVNTVIKCPKCNTCIEISISTLKERKNND